MSQSYPEIDHVESAHEYIERIHRAWNELDEEEKRSELVQALTHLQAEMGIGGFEPMSDEEWEAIGMESPWKDPHEEDTCINCGRQPTVNGETSFHPLPSMGDHKVLCDICAGQIQDRGSKP